MTNKSLKNILYIGNYNPDYIRNHNFIQGLRNHNINVIEFNTNKYRNKSLIRFLIKNFKRFLNLKYDAIIYYSFRNSISFMFSKLLAFLKGVPLIHDVHISKLLTYYNVYGLKNRKRFIPKILYYLYFYVLEFLLCHLSDFVVLDTASHIKYFRETFKIPLKKFRKIYVGSREDYFYPIECEKSDNHNILVGFWGSFIQASGVNYIIKAIASLKEQKNLSLLLLGGGITYEKDKELVKRLNLKNVKFLDFVPVKEVAKIIANCDIGLGIFGAFFKVDLVIPNKLFDGMAMKIPMISAESAAVRELFTEGKDIILCDPGNSKSLADAILKLINNKRLRYEISENAYRLFKKYCTTNKIGERLIKILLEKIDK